MRLLAVVDAFLEHAQTADAEELRRWLPEVFEWQRELESMRGNVNATHLLRPPRPDVERRLFGLRCVVGKAEVIGRYDDEGQLVLEPLPWLEA